MGVSRVGATVAVSGVAVTVAVAVEVDLAVAAEDAAIFATKGHPPKS